MNITFQDLYDIVHPLKKAQPNPPTLLNTSNAMRAIGLNPQHFAGGNRANVLAKYGMYPVHEKITPTGKVSRYYALPNA